MSIFSLKGSNDKPKFWFLPKLILGEQWMCKVYLQGICMELQWHPKISHTAVFTQSCGGSPTAALTELLPLSLFSWNSLIPPQPTKAWAMKAQLHASWEEWLGTQVRVQWPCPTVREHYNQQILMHWNFARRHDWTHKDGSCSAWKIVLCKISLMKVKFKLYIT